MRSPEEMGEYYAICQACPLFRRGEGYFPGYDLCGECGCNLHPSAETLNKLAWATTKCPKNPPEWPKDERIKKEVSEDTPNEEI